VLVRGVIVGDQVQVEVARRLAIDLLEKTQPFDMGMVGLGTGYQFPGELAQCREQRNGAVPDVIMRHRGRAFRRQRQSQLRAFECLALAFLVTAQHQGFLRWVEVEPDHIPELRLESRVIRQLEGLQPMRLQLVP
jgi:hypothetical protein